MDGTAPRERYLASLPALFRLREPPRPFKKRRELVDYFARQQNPVDAWGSRHGERTFADFWDEHVKGDTHIALCADGMVGRFIRTAAVKIYRVRHHTSEQLVEYLVDPTTGRRIPRNKRNGVSEKMRMHEASVAATVRRGLYEELDIHVDHQSLNPPLLQFLGVPVQVGAERWVQDDEFGAWSQLEVRDTGPYPGVRTFNQIFHLELFLLKKYWRDAYINTKHPGRVYESIWEDVAP